MKKLSFGIVLPTCNRPDTLIRALNSVLNQTYNQWKLVIVDDSTNAETYQWSKTYQFDPRITYIKNSENKGVGATRNAALNALVDQVDFIVFLDDDDYFDKDCLLNANGFIRRNDGINWYLSRRINYRDNTSITAVNEVKEQYDYIKDLLFGGSIKKDATHFISTEAINEVCARFDERFRTGGEWRFFIQIGEHNPVKFFEGGVTYSDYLPGGLSEANSRNYKFRLSQQYDKYKVLEFKQLYPEKQVRLIRNVSKFAFKLRDASVIRELRKKHFSGFPKTDLLKIRARLALYGLLLGVLGSKN